MKKITFLEILLFSLMTVSISMSIFGRNVTTKTLHFEVDMRSALVEVNNKNTIGIRGNIAPLSWDKTYYFKDKNQDGIYEGNIELELDATILQFKFVHSDVIWELATETNRVIDLAQKEVKLPTYIWNESLPFTQTEIKAMTISKEKLLEDFELVKTAYTTMHPGLYRYNTPAQVEQNLANLKTDLAKDLTIPAAYVAFSKFVATIKCGHTYANYWNQPTVVKRSVTYQADKVPFHFRITENRMIITQSAVEHPMLKRGTEVLTINGKPIAEILATLIPLQHTDGANVGQQIVNLQLFGADKFEAFDMYFPILFPPTNGEYELTVADFTTKEKATINVPAMSRKERVNLIKKRFPNTIPEVGPDLWQFKMIDDQTALLTLHSFSIWNWDFEWKTYLEEVFKQLKTKAVPNLIIDIRLNGGGSDMVGFELLKNISQQPIISLARKEMSRFTEFPTSVKPYLKTWDKWFETKGIKKLKPIQEGYYSMDGKISAAQTFKPYKDNYKGKVFLLVSPFNSSATYYLAGTAQRINAATLVGQETGGNQQGINGGLIYFLTLPNSQIELDIPVMGDFQIGDKPNRGYIPEILVQPNVVDIANGVDTELAAVLALIAEKQKN